jgi:MscS family membrane protein
MLTLENLPLTWKFIPVGVAVVLIIIALPKLTRLVLRIKENIISSKTQEVYQKVIEPDRDILELTLILLVADLILLITAHIAPQIDLFDLIEFPVGLSVTLVIGWLGNQLLKRYFKIYLTQLTMSGRRINEDLLIGAEWISFLIFCIILITIFSQTHKINVLGLIASLGIGGVALAFAAQKTLEQLLGGIVLYLDRPFLIDDYIGLPDGTFGRVESIGLRSTKIRVSGKGTLMVVPNNYLTGINIENFTGAGKSINVVKLNFSDYLLDNQKAFIKQLFMESGPKQNDFDSRNIEVTFQEIMNKKGQKITQAQVKFLMATTNESSKEFKLQIMKIVSDNVRQKLLEHGINYEVVDRIWIDSKISI